MALTPREKLAAAIIRVCEPPNGLAPYFGVMLRGLVRREDPGLGTVGVTRDGILLWDPAFIEKHDVNTLGSVMLHEVMHVVLKHHDRAEKLGVVPDPSPESGTKAAIANLAMDACINEEIRKIPGAKLPPTVVYPEKLGQKEGLIFEERYRLLEKAVDKARAVGACLPGACHGWCGSGAGRPVPDEPIAHGKKDPDGRSAAEMERFRKATADAVREFGSKGRGVLPASLQRWADQMLAPPKIAWQEKLARIVRGAVAYQSGAVDYTWSRPSRRQAGVGFGPGRPIVPALHAPLPNVAVGVDTSGSMSEQDLADAASEVQGVLRAVGAEITVLAADAKVHGVKKCRDIREAVGLFVGGGGTDMTPIFDELETYKDKPSVVVIVTDGHIGGGHPEVEPSWAKVIWAVIGEHGNVDCCSWGEIVHVVDDKKAT